MREFDEKNATPEEREAKKFIFENGKRLDEVYNALGYLEDYAE